MFPVGLVTQAQLSAPIIDTSSGKVVDFYDGYLAGRKFPVDMAGFAVNLGYYRRVGGEWFWVCVVSCVILNLVATGIRWLKGKITEARLRCRSKPGWRRMDSLNDLTLTKPI